MNTLLETSWSRAIQGLGAADDGLIIRDELIARYSESHRRYHSLQHLEECLALFESIQHAADRPVEVEMALWFHDAIYDVHRSDNELRSADWAVEELRRVGVATDSVARVRELILVTKHTGVPTSDDEKVLVDVDLSILGASADRFAQYEDQIRMEYSHVPELLFRLKRREILESFLDRAAIYSTPILHRRLEARARANLSRALESLENRDGH